MNYGYKNYYRTNKKAVAIGLCASLIGGVAAPVLSTANVAHAAVAVKPQVNTTHDSVIQFKDPMLKERILSEMKKQNLIDKSAQDITEADALKIENLDLAIDYHLGDSSLSLENIEKFKNLKSLDLTGNKLSLKPLINLPQLSKLYLDGQSFKFKFSQSRGCLYNEENLLLLKHLPSLKELTVRTNTITPLAGLTNLTSLAVWSNQITDITPLAGLTNLTSLAVWSNQITDITPLKGLTNLTSLNLSHNQITDITPLAGLTNLTDLGLSCNQIVDFSLLKSKNIKNYLSTSPQVFVIKAATRDIVVNKEVSTNGRVGKLIDFGESFATFNPVTNVLALKEIPKETTLQGESKYHRIRYASIKDESPSTFMPDYVFYVDFTPYINSLKERVKASGAPEEEQQKIIEKMNSGTLTVEQFEKDITELTRKAKFHDQTIQTEDMSAALAALLKDADNIKACANYKNADDNLKQAYDTAITDGQKVYNKLSSTPEQVQQACAQIKAAFSKLNGDAKASASASQLQNRIQQLEQALEQLKAAKKQADEKNQQTIAGLNTQITQLTKDKQGLQEQINGKQTEISKLQEQIQALKNDHSKSDTEKQKEIDRLSGQVASLTQEKQGLQEKLDAANEKVRSLTQQLQQTARKADADAKQIRELTRELQQTKQQLEQLKSDKTKSDEQKQQEIDTLNAKIAELEKKVQTCSAQAVGGALVAPLVNEKPTFDIEKYKREHNYMLPGIATHTYQTKQDTFTSDVHAALQQLAPMAASTNAAAQATAQRTDESERAQAEQKADTSSKQEAEQAKLEQKKFPQTGDNSLLTLLSTFAGALVLVLGCFARKKQSRNINKK